MKKTVFISLLDGTEEEVRVLAETLATVPHLRDNYHGVVTSQPVQAMNPLDLIEQLKHIHNVQEDGDPNGVGITRTDRFRRQLRYNLRFMEAVTSMIESMEQNIEELGRMFNSHAGLPEHSAHMYFNKIQSAFDVGRLKTLVDQMKDVNPKEGEMM